MSTSWVGSGLRRLSREPTQVASHALKDTGWFKTQLMPLGKKVGLMPTGDGSAHSLREPSRRTAAASLPSAGRTPSALLRWNICGGTSSRRPALPRRIRRALKSSARGSACQLKASACKDMRRTGEDEGHVKIVG